MVPIVDLSRRAARYGNDYLDAARRVLARGHLLLGDELVGFEAEFAAFAGADHCVAVGSGATAIQLGLAALGVGPGDEVLVPAFTAVPTASAVCALGAVPVPVEVDPATAAMDLDAARRAVTERTTAVVPVHLYGRPAPLPTDLAALGLPILEDAAQAHGAVGPAHGRPSAATAYSFYPTKNLGGVGDGGALVTDDGDLATLVRRLRKHGMSEQYVHTEISQSSRISELECAWLRLLLPDLAAANARRREVVAAYRAAAPDLAWHADHPQHVYHLAVVRVSERERVRAALAGRGVGSGVHYPLAMTEQPAYRHFVRAACPEAEGWAASCLSLPCFPEITDDEVAVVCGALASVQDLAAAGTRS